MPQRVLLLSLPFPLSVSKEGGLKTENVFVIYKCNKVSLINITQRYEQKRIRPQQYQQDAVYPNDRQVHLIVSGTNTTRKRRPLLLLVYFRGLFTSEEVESKYRKTHNRV